MTQQAQPIIDRHAARVVLLDAQDRMLLFRCQEPGSDRAFWITPGGGLEKGETHEQAALRELREETGLSNIPIGPCVWTRSHQFPWLGQVYRQHERFYLMRIDTHQVDIGSHTEEEKLALTEHRWWSSSQIDAATDQLFAPSRMGYWFKQLILNRHHTPIDVGA